jgi:hypothetical protein
MMGEWGMYDVCVNDGCDVLISGIERGLWSRAYESQLCR